MHIFQFVLLFFLYAFCGWCAEVVFAAANYGKFVNRGFLLGPVCPIYGIGVLLVHLLLGAFENSLPLLFLLSALLTTSIEFICGFLSEKLLGMRLWDYSKQPFNIGGYICLKFSLLWGLACVFILKLIHPMFEKLVLFIPIKLSAVLAVIFSAVFVADLIVTLIEARKLPNRLKAIDELDKALSSISDGIGAGIAAPAMSLRGKREELKTKLLSLSPEMKDKAESFNSLIIQKNSTHSRLIAAFPSIHQGRFGKAAARISLYRRSSRRKENESNAKKR